MEKLKERWGIDSNFQIFVILLVFSINGSLAVLLANPITDFSRPKSIVFINWLVMIAIVSVLAHG